MIVEFPHNASLLKKFPRLLSQSNIIRVKQLPDESQVGEWIGASFCPQCETATLLLLGQGASGHLVGITAKCRSCEGDLPIFLSSRPIKQAVLVNVQGPFEDEPWKKQIKDIACPTCHAACTAKSPLPDPGCLTNVFPFQFGCPRCEGSVFNVLFREA